MKFKLIFFRLLCIIAISPFSLKAQLPYDTASIPMDIRQEAHTFKRDEKIEVDIQDADKVIYHIQRAVTIFDSKGNSELYFQQYTDKFITMESVELRVYDAKGLLLSKYQKKDMLSHADGEGLVEDGKSYFLKIPAPQYPLTIETNLEIRYKGLYKIPAYQVSQPYQAVIHSSYKLRFPESMEINAKAYAIDLKPVKEQKDGKKMFLWEVSGLPAKKYEEKSGPWSSNFPHVLFNSNRIKYDGFPGDMSSWKEMGAWYNQLVKNINVLSDAYKSEIRQIVSGAPNDKEKIRILYTYLQKNFRYVSIQLGIGGFRPFPADFVHEKKYGDCKALSNYMEACLKAVDIKSYSAWINAGQDKSAVDPSFPYDAFNHQILCVPLVNDTVWLECTSNYNDFGHLGNFTENRHALLLTEQGGVLVKTPVSKPEENIFRMNSVVNLNDDGSGIVRSELHVSGEFKYEQIYLSMEKTDIQKQFLVNQMGFINPDDYSIQFSEKYMTPFQTSLALEMEKVPDFMAGTKMFIRPRMYSFWSEKLPATDKRLYDYIFDCPFEKSDTTKFILPEGFVVESLPAALNMEFSYGKFRSNYWFEETSRTIYTTAFLKLDQYRIPPEKFTETRDFIDKLKKEDSKKLIIRKL